MQDVSEQFSKLYAEYYEEHSLSFDHVTRQLLQHLRATTETPPHVNSHTPTADAAAAGAGERTRARTNSTAAVVFILSAIVAIASVLCMKVDAFVVFNRLDYLIRSQACIVENNAIFLEVARPLFDCDVCQNITQVDVLQDITREEFTRKYAFTKVPVLIQGGARNWSAPGVFSFDFFKQLYSEEELLTSMDQCMFFPYNTEFSSLREVFENMSPGRANLEAGEEPWYIGWSNCDPDVKQQLRQHYSTPHFLPADAEHSSLDWLFMGGPGNGAHIHIDNVAMPSWQAQLSGKKTWSLLPVPECEALCHPLNVTLHTGDIFVVDTNHWYHSTRIHPGAVSITIGSEYN